MNEILKIIGLMGLMGFISLTGKLGAAVVIPESVITWQARNYAPDFFPGKKLPIGGTIVNFSVQLLENNRLVDASDKEVRWYIDNDLVDSGIGLDSFNYIIPQNSGDLVLMRNVIIYRGVEVNQFLEIPVVDPEVVIDSSQLPELKPYFYFFNIASPDDLRLNWEENNQSIALTAQNAKNLLETAQSTIKKP